MEAGELGCQRSPRDLAQSLFLSPHFNRYTSKFLEHYYPTIMHTHAAPSINVAIFSTGTDKGAYDRLSMPTVDLSRQLGSSADLVAPILWLLIDGS
jgi:hypothetical protein